MRAYAQVERAGIRGVAIATAGFDLQAEVIGRLEGMAAAKIARYPGVILTDTEEEFRRNVRESVLPAVLAGLLEDGARTDRAAPRDEPDYQPTDIVARGSLDEVLDVFHSKQWSDGLPFVPPTLDRVHAFVDRSGRAPSDVVGVVLPTHREATVWSIAVNAVMAGCRPEYMPLLVALTEAAADPRFKLSDAGATPGWEPLVTVSGPIVEELGFNFDAGALRIGRQANSSVGRFLRLYMGNVGGLQIPPGTSDQAGFGMNFNVALAENGAATDEIGWPTLGVDEGYPRSVSTVSVQSVVAISGPIYSAGSAAEQHLRTVAPMFCNTIGPGCAGWGYSKEILCTLLAISPSVARIIAGDGWSKGDVRTYLGENMKINAQQINERLAASADLHNFKVERTPRGRQYLDAAGIDPATESADIEMPALVDLDLMAITVAGNPTRNQSRAFVGNHAQGVRVTRPIVMP
jgi:hypothetical protein